MNHDLPYLSSLLSYDPDTGNFTWKVTKSSSATKGSLAGCTDNEGYRVIHIDRKQYKAHRLAYLFHHGYVPDLVDHINQDKGDNRISNLRAATRSQNAWNRGTGKNSSTGVRNVVYIPSRNKYRVKIKQHGKCHQLGEFTSLEEAAQIAKEGRERLHGEFATH